MTDHSEIGQLIARYERDEDEANRNTLMTLVPIVAGAVVLFFGGLRLIRDQSNGIFFAVLGGMIFWIGFMMHRGTRISLQAVELGERGIRWNDDHYPASMCWNEIQYIEVVRSKETGEVSSLFLCEGDETGQLLSRGILRDFDELIEQLDTVAKDHDIPFRPA